MSTWHPVQRFPRWLSWLPDRLYTPLRWALRLSIILLILVGAVVFYYGLKASEYDIEKVAGQPEQTIVLDRDGKPIDIGLDSGRQRTARNKLPPFLLEALTAREDARFFTHHGVDFRGLARATIRNIKDRDFTQGASTLTMQLARNTYDLYSPWASFASAARELDRKMLEIAVSFRIESHYTKDEILTCYLNRIYFGSGCHGLSEAAQAYFGKRVDQLHPGECAMLAGIIRGPHIFSPARNLKAARRQQGAVLDRMLEVGNIDEAEKARILALPIRIDPETRSAENRSYGLRAVRAELTTLLEACDIRGDGLVVGTTLDRGWQLTLETALSKTIRELEDQPSWKHPRHAGHQQGRETAYLQCAAVTLESNSGRILAWVGGRDYVDSRYDRATGARRDLGDALEPWIAAAAAERGKRILPGRPLVTGRQIGPQEVIRIAERCGLGGRFLDTEDLFRGSGAASPIEAATALATLASNGQRPRAFFVESIHKADGSALYEHPVEPSRALSRHAAKEAVALFESSGQVRCFSGMTASQRDAWLLRIGPTGSTAIWIGFDDPATICSAAKLESALNDLIDALAR